MCDLPEHRKYTDFCAVPHWQFAALHLNRARFAARHFYVMLFVDVVDISRCGGVLQEKF